MIRRVVGLFVLAIVAGVIGTLIAQDPGYVLLVWSEFSLETSIWFAGVMLLAMLLVLRVLLAFFDLVFGSRRGVRDWNQARKHRRAQRSTQAGLLALARGEFAVARKALERFIDDAEAPLLNLLAAARAAHGDRDLRGRDALLELALEQNPDATLAVGLTRAELLMSAGQWEAALAAILPLRREAPQNAHVLRLMHRCQGEIGDASGVPEWLPEARKGGNLPKDEFEQFEREAWIVRLGETADPPSEQTPAAALDAVWRQVPRPLRTHPDVLAAHALRLDEIGSGSEAEKLLRKALGRRWAGSLVNAYAGLVSADALQRFEQAQRWTKKHGEDADLQGALARLAVEVGEAQAARGYYEQALSLREDRALRLDYARFLHAHGDAEAAAEMFVRALPGRVDARPGVEPDEADGADQRVAAKASPLA